MQGKDLTLYFVTIGVMILLVMGLGVAIFILRGRLFGNAADGDGDPGGVLETMRAMRDRGEIPEEEYRAAQAALVAKATAARAVKPGAAPRRTNPPAAGERRAPPGFDLTGAPLPPTVRGGDDETGRAVP
ncbi:MAG TPA: hypothetical protein VFF69_13505 [Phycisphaerales bacterium]|nr:hypothetical protein [Phycisphaerales bacterium]